jgi:hypothetical protein
VKLLKSQQIVILANHTIQQIESFDTTRSKVVPRFSKQPGCHSVVAFYVKFLGLDVPGMILKDGARMTLTGIGIGLVASLGLTRLMTKMLFGVSLANPLTFGGVVALLCFVALFACYVPAHRAVDVDPLVALRHN